MTSELISFPPDHAHGRVEGSLSRTVLTKLRVPHDLALIRSKNTSASVNLALLPCSKYRVMRRLPQRRVLEWGRAGVTASDIATGTAPRRNMALEPRAALTAAADIRTPFREPIWRAIDGYSDVHASYSARTAAHYAAEARRDAACLTFFAHHRCAHRGEVGRLRGALVRRSILRVRQDGVSAVMWNALHARFGMHHHAAKCIASFLAVDSIVPLTMVALDEIKCGALRPCFAIREMLGARRVWLTDQMQAGETRSVTLQVCGRSCESSSAVQMIMMGLATVATSGYVSEATVEEVGHDGRVGRMLMPWGTHGSCAVEYSTRCSDYSAESLAFAPGAHVHAVRISVRHNYRGCPVAAGVAIVRCEGRANRALRVVVGGGQARNAQCD